MNIFQELVEKYAVSVSIARLEPNDVIVLTSHRKLSPEEVSLMIKQGNMAWPNHRIVVLDDGMQMKVARSEERP